MLRLYVKILLSIQDSPRAVVTGLDGSRCLGLKTTLTRCLGERSRTTGACEGSEASRTIPTMRPLPCRARAFYRDSLLFSLQASGFSYKFCGREFPESASREMHSGGRSLESSSAALGISPAGSNARITVQLRRALIPERESRLLRTTGEKYSPKLTAEPLQGVG